MMTRSFESAARWHRLGILMLLYVGLCRACLRNHHPSVSPVGYSHEVHVQSKTFLQTIAVSSALWTTTAYSAIATQPAMAADDTGLREQISSIASNIPGYGARDIIYPPDWQGFWDVSETITGYQATTNKLPLMYGAELNSVGTTVKYKISFAEHNQQVINDRAYSLASEYSERLKRKALCFWQPDNPNLSRISVAGADYSLVNPFYLYFINLRLPHWVWGLIFDLFIIN